MSSDNNTPPPFRFYTKFNLSELTGLKAANVSQLLQHIKQVPGSSIYHHTHRFLQIHQYLSPEPPNDFAYWVTDVLGEDELGERLASIDTVQFSTIRNLREKLTTTIEDYLQQNPLVRMKFAPEGEEFHFMKSISFVMPTSYVAYNLQDFVRILEKITVNSIYFHIFEAKIRLEKQSNDFSYWIGASLGNRRLAQRIAGLDPYTRTLDDLRKGIIKIIRESL
jgi:hypothetical protein